MPLDSFLNRKSECIPRPASRAGTAGLANKSENSKYEIDGESIGQMAMMQRNKNNSPLSFACPVKCEAYFPGEL